MPETPEEFVHRVASLTTWRDRCTKIAHRYGTTDPDMIEEFIQAEQMDLDYLIDRNNEFEDLIEQARQIVGG